MKRGAGWCFGSAGVFPGGLLKHYMPQTASKTTEKLHEWRPTATHIYLCLNYGVYFTCFLFFSCCTVLFFSFFFHSFIHFSQLVPPPPFSHSLTFSLFISHSLCSSLAERFDVSSHSQVTYAASSGCLCSPFYVFMHGQS